MSSTANGEERAKTIPIYIMGKRYEVPETLTILKAMEYVGFKFVRGCGCRGGICGACGTVYRKAGDYRLRVGLACQTVAEPDMHLTQIPFYPANRASYDLKELAGRADEVFQLYPEVFRCLACNSCTKACPMGIDVMQVMAAILRGDLKEAAISSFDCIQCGLCASRCLGELPQYHIIQLVRRLYSAKIVPKASHLREANEAVKSGRYEEALRGLMSMDEAGLRKLYAEREMEPWETGEEWRPKDKSHLYL